MKNPIVALKESYGGLPSSLYVLFIARIINRMGGFVHAFLALYLSTKLGFSEGQIAEYIILVGILSTFAPFIGGRIADVRGRKTIYILAQSLAALMFVPCGLLTDTHPEMVPIFLIMASMISSIVDPINGAMVADIAVLPEQRKKAYALLYLGTNVGVAIGPMIGGFLLNRYVVLFFLGDALTTFISVLLVALFVKETKLSHEEMKKMQGGERMEEGNTLQVLLKKPVLLLFALFSILTSFVYAQSNFGMSLFMAHTFGASNGPAYYGLLMSFNAVVVLVFTLPVTSLLKRNRPVINIVLAAMLYSVGFGLFGYIDRPLLLLYIPVLIWTLGEIISVTNHSVFVMSHTPVNFRGRFNAFLGFLSGFGYIISPKLMSKLIEGYDFSYAWKVIGIIAFLATIGFLYVALIDRKQESSILDTE